MVGGFRVIRYTEHRPVACVPTHTATLFLEEPEELETYRRIVGDLGATALSPIESQEWLSGLASEYDRLEAGLKPEPG
ncbi:Scr1 family TA system antitoxin-like transcriptional regulator [Amycolatopsis nigrescens]|uniref:Scr1 family TA system antitoxin-like transcriptional regulator n=1 Tax=Amycolatopsis nigrescens TaxID=381445 RepID=UPI00036CA38C|nr:Scr1 family TA system antitoxin-like transcriptional regulator [Amycolatopsis nigrescens]